MTQKPGKLGDFRELKLKKIPRSGEGGGGGGEGEFATRNPRNLFGKSVSIYPRSLTEERLLK